jgi:hypothetical protein
MASFSHRLGAVTMATISLIGLAFVVPAGAVTLTSLQGPLPSDTMPAVNADLNAVSCSSSSECVAVGRYESKTSGGEAVIDTESFGSWSSAIRVTLPSNAEGFANGVLNGVSCVAAGYCTAVGQYEATSGYKAMIVTERHGVWGSAIQSPTPAGAISATVTSLNAISCVSTSSCVAVGQYADHSGNQGFSITLSGTKWVHATRALLPRRSKSNFITQLDGVSCVAVGYCIAVGEYVNTSPAREGMILTESSGVWRSSVKAPLPANADFDPWAALYGVSCVSWGDCEAVGVYRDPSGGQGVTLCESSGHWQTGQQAPLPSSVTGATRADQLLSVSCATATSCVAAGMYTSGANDQGVVLIESKGHWGRGAVVPRPANAISPPYGIANGVSCSTSCVAVGQYQSSTGEPSLITYF